MFSMSTVPHIGTASARGANPFRNVGGTPSGVDPFFGLGGGGGS